MSSVEEKSRPEEAAPASDKKLEEGLVISEKESVVGTSDDSVEFQEKDPDNWILNRLGGTDTWYGGLVSKLFALGVEARGVERVKEEDRKAKAGWIWGNMLMWFSVNMVLTTIPIGTLAPDFGLDVPTALGTMVGFGLLGCATTAFIATLGPKTGLRTMIITRFSSGWAGGIIFSILNILTQLGFSVIAVILGGQALSAVNGMPLTVGVIIISLLSLAVCFVGYSYIHIYERYAWMVLSIVMIMLYALGGKAGYDISSLPKASGSTLAGGVLTFGGIIFGSCSGWSPVAADYNMQLPADTSSTKIFFLTMIGLFVPIFFCETLGLVLITITNPDYVAAFTNGGTGGLLNQVLSVWGGFGKFILVILGLSVVANNIPNTYSAALSIQALGKPMQAIPRFAWTILVAVIYCVAGVAGQQHFSDILTNLLAILSYWTAFFVVIVLEEHFIFRRSGGILGGYNLNSYNVPSELPYGVASILSMCFGVAGFVVGMNAVYFVGPIAKMIGDEGGDLGFELAFAFAGVTFPVFRYIEIKLTGR